jgi:membrane protein DedA with SNARE-associated domain
MVESLIAKWGYAAVGAGVFFEGETIVLVAGAMAHRGLLSLWGVIVAAFIGSFCGDQLWFWLGVRYGKRFVERRPAWRRRAQRANALLARFGSWYVLAFRFLYGLRTISPLFLGSVGYPIRRFTVLNALSAAVWATTFSVGGYAVGATLTAALGRATRPEEVVLACVAVGLVLWIVARRSRENPSSRDDEALQHRQGSGPALPPRR